MLRILNEAAAMAREYSLADVLERMYENQLALEAALMELTLQKAKREDHLRSAKMYVARCSLSAKTQVISSKA